MSWFSNTIETSSFSIDTQDDLIKVYRMGMMRFLFI